MDKIRLKHRIWVSNGEYTFLGEGRIQLLELIRQHGSIAKAAKEMKMSYKKAWELVASISNSVEHPLVIGQIGGKNGGGSSLSEEGLNWISDFQELNRRVTIFLENEIEQLMRK